MDDVIRVLVGRLARKGIEPGSIPAYIRDLAHAIPNHTDPNLPELNRRMQLLGWYGSELDDHTLQLITAVLELDDRHSWERGAAPPIEEWPNIRRSVQTHP